jgi:phosphatidylglycerophosphatase A
MKDKITLFLATGCGLGLFVPFAPGTFGSLPGVALAYALSTLPVLAQIAACAALALLAVPVCGRAETLLGVRDDGRIAADEWMLYPIALIGLPVSSLPWWAMAVFFCVVRLVDIIKPPPAKGLQSLPGGWGVMVDDLVANLYSLAINWVVFTTCFA